MLSKRVPLALALSAVLTLTLTSLHAQDNWIAGTGNWNDAGNWDSGVPNDPATSVAITNGTAGTPSLVNLDINASIKDLQLGSFDTLYFNRGTQLSVYGTQIVNDGQINVNAGGADNTSLVLNNSVTLSGAGTVTLSTAGGGGNAYIEQAVDGATLTNQSTIQGAGIIGNSGLALSNSGTINANSSGQTLLLNGSGGITNTGLLEATNSGVLQIGGVTVDNAGGNITANGVGATVQAVNATIKGGAMNTLAGGTLETIGTSVLDGSTHGALTLNGVYKTSNGNTTDVLGTINNQGNFQVNGDVYHTFTTLSLFGNTTLQGGGTVTLNSLSGFASLYLTNQLGATVTNVNNTIQGEGIIERIGATLINEAGGTINANYTGGLLSNSLTLYKVSVTNSGLLEATNSGLLDLEGNTINNAGGNITANGAGAAVFVSDATIQGGTLNILNYARMNTEGISVLDGSTQGVLTLNGVYWTNDGATTKLFGVINNHGNFQVGPGAYGTYLTTLGNTTLQGGGTVTLLTEVYFNGDAWLYQNGAYTLDNVDNSIQGEGIIYNNGATLINEAGGTINANSTGSPLITTLQIQGGTVTNSGLLEATNSGVLRLDGNTINNTDGNITADGAGATVQVVNATIQGGTLNVLNGATMETIGTSVLDGSTHGALTLNGTYTTSAGNATHILGTINNAGGNITVNGAGATVQVADATIQGGTLNVLNGATMETIGTSVLDGSTQGALTLNGIYSTSAGNATQVMGTINNQGNFLVDGSVSDTYLTTVGNTALQGGGTVTLKTYAGGGHAWLLQGPYTLDNVNNTIQGEGIIYNNGAALINEAGGTIIANSTGSPQTSTLEIDYGTVTNKGTFQANSGNLLHLVGGAFTNFSGNTLTGGSYNVYGTMASPGTLQIDSLGSNGGEIVNNAATILLDGPNSNFVDGSTKDALYNFNNNTAMGSFTIENARSFISPGHFANAGAMNIGANSNFLTAGNYNQSGGSTRVDGSLRTGGGQVNINGGALLGNGGTITGNVMLAGILSPGDAPGSAGALHIVGNYLQTATGIFNLGIGGLTPGTQFSLLTVTGSSSLLGTLNISLLNGFFPGVGDTFTFLTSGTGVNGMFSTANGTDIGNGEEFMVIYGNRVVYIETEQLKPAPEPTTLLVLAPGLLGVGYSLRRKLLE